jgi:tyrosinase
VSYAKGVEAMLKLPADHPQNWFRNAFIHLMDCPHGNWWFYVWHRGYLGYFERTIRSLSKDESFAMPYWDWTALPQIPDGMFDGVLTPRDKAYEPYTKSLGAFTSFIKPAMTKYWSGLSAAQRTQLNNRGYKTFDDMWNDVTGNGDPANMAFAATDIARYLTRSNPKLDDKTKVNVTMFYLLAGLLPTDFYNGEAIELSFNSSKTDSHNKPPSGPHVFSTLEGFPHNKVHNYIGGYGAHPAPWGNMTNNLSPVDPVFFLHHSNMDRLWDVWTRKQQRLRLPYLPTKPDERHTYSTEPFLFYVDGNGNYVGPSTAGRYVSTALFDYDYEPGSGEVVVNAPRTLALTTRGARPITGTVSGNTATVVVPRPTLQHHLGAALARPLTVDITLTRPAGASAPREFDVIVNAPPGVTHVNGDSPYFAGTIAFFGAPMHGMDMSGDATFAVPLRRTLRAFTALGAAASSTTLKIQVVPSQGQGPAPALKAVSVGTV